MFIYNIFFLQSVHHFGSIIAPLYTYLLFTPNRSGTFEMGLVPFFFFFIYYVHQKKKTKKKKNKG
jgi:hypothetical protein